MALGPMESEGKGVISWKCSAFRFTPQEVVATLEQSAQVRIQEDGVDEETDGCRVPPLVEHERRSATFVELVSVREARERVGHLLIDEETRPFHQRDLGSHAEQE